MQLTPPSGTFTSDDVLNQFLDYLIDSGVEMYDHQEEAVLELFAGSNVILNTPTGSGKSLVALALHYQSLCSGKTSYYTVPIKALANEKFLSLCATFGPDKVGMITGDATVNPDAPIICCTAEIVSNLALREGSEAKVDDVIMDEFHYYSDHERGVAWQLPLLTLPQSRFLLMSATIGDTSFFQKEITTLTKKETVLVQSDQRPVPLEFVYSEIPLTEQVTELVEKNKAPVYLVHFAQRACAESAQALLSSNFCSKEEKRQIAEALQEANFRSPYGKEVSKLLRHGIGIHHAGLLPKYRLLVEKLTQQGLLKVVCGTDTLGVGVNVPIRSVLFTQLCKYDGTGTKILSVRDFKQISGRAGRRGFDDIGYVVAQAPAHVIENIRLEAKAAASAKKKKVVKKKPPEKGFVSWSKETFAKLQTADPEPLVSSFKLRHNLMLNVLSRTNEDGCRELKRLIEASHETEASKKKIRRHARSMFMALVRGKVLTITPPAERGEGENVPKVKLHVDLQDDFTMNQALGLYLIETIPMLDAEAPDYALNVLSLIEAILENPVAVLRAQVNEIKSELINELKAEGMDYDQRMDKLDEVTHPMPGKDFIYDTFNEFNVKHPWIESENIRPKSIAREMFVDYMSFEDYIRKYKLERSEAILLRHLSEGYKVLSQTVPPALKTEELLEAERYLKEHLTSVDSSLIDEWETMKDPDYVRPEDREVAPERERPITQDKKKFARLLHHQIFTAVKYLSADNIAGFMEVFEPSDEWTAARIDEQLDAYYDGRQLIRLDPEARNQKHTHTETLDDTRQLRINQTLCDPDERNDWSLTLLVDLQKSDEKKEPVIHLENLGPVV
ncbi:DUF3516 domain-containing protein [Verrucomicrobiaceae bacterium R5-34]|nr:DUF3516 domain-containing protein [Verrucomicrobiaceae bacterium R5-34]